MISIESSFWAQAISGAILAPLITFMAGRLLNPKYSSFFAYGLGLTLSALLVFLITFVLLQHTAPSRGWGGLIFVYVLLAEAIVGGIGMVSMLIALVMRLARR